MWISHKFFWFLKRRTNIIINVHVRTLGFLAWAGLRILFNTSTKRTNPSISCSFSSTVFSVYKSQCSAPSMMRFVAELLHGRSKNRLRQYFILCIRHKKHTCSMFMLKLKCSHSSSKRSKRQQHFLYFGVKI